MCEIFLQGLSKTSEEPGYEPESSRTWGDANHSARKVPQCLQAELKFSGEKMNRGNPRKKSNHTEAPPPPFSLGLGRCSCYAGWGIWSFSSVMRGRHGVGTLNPATTAPPCIITFSSASDQSQNVMTQYRFGFSSYHYHKNTLWSRINKQVFRLLESCEIFAALCLEQMPLELHPTPHQTQCTAWVNRRHKVNVWMLSRWSALVAGSIPALKCEAKGTYWNFH